MASEVCFSLTLKSGRTTDNGALLLNGDHRHTGTTTVSTKWVKFYGNNELATGDFVVKAGAVAYLGHANAISSKATVSLEKSGVVYAQLTMNQSVTVAGLQLDGVAQLAGVYNSTTHSDYFQGAGNLTVHPRSRGTVFRVQ